MKVLGLIPARGGSKGFSGKNLRHLHGKPLLRHSVENALNASCISTVVVSTDQSLLTGKRVADNYQNGVLYND